MLAAAKGNTNVVRILLPKSDTKATTLFHYTALMFAAESGSQEIVELLLPKSDIAAINWEGKTALDLAEAREHKNTSKIIRLSYTKQYKATP